jgi:hypothetical protein
MLVLIGCFVKKEAMVFEHLEMLDNYDTSIRNGKVLRERSKFFLVEGYRSKKKNDLLIDRFARNIEVQEPDTLSQLTIPCAILLPHKMNRSGKACSGLFHLHALPPMHRAPKQLPVVPIHRAC